jgi:hypothetical protein
VELEESVVLLSELPDGLSLLYGSSRDAQAYERRASPERPA